MVPESSRKARSSKAAFRVQRHWEHARWAPWDKTGNFFIYPIAYARTGPGKALDGLPKFDLTRFDPAHFERLRTVAAGQRGIYVAVKLFEDWSIEFQGLHPPSLQIPARNPYCGHPFNAANNINGIDGDPSGSGQGKAIHTLRIPAITRLQEAHAREVIDTVKGQG